MTVQVERKPWYRELYNSVARLALLAGLALALVDVWPASEWFVTPVACSIWAYVQGYRIGRTR